MLDVYGITLPANASADRIAAAQLQLMRNPRWREDMAGLFAVKRNAKAAQEQLTRAHQAAIDAERQQLAALPSDVTPEQAQAYLRDVFMADPRFRAVLNSAGEDHPLYARLVAFQDQLVAWAHPPERVVSSDDPAPAPEPTPQEHEIDRLRRGLISGEIAQGSAEHKRFRNLAGTPQSIETGGSAPMPSGFGGPTISVGGGDGRPSHAEGTGEPVGF